MFYYIKRTFKITVFYKNKSFLKISLFGILSNFAKNISQLIFCIKNTHMVTLKKFP